MNGIKMSDCRFYVDEDARTIVCVIPKTQDLVTDFIRENFQFSDINMYDMIDFWNRRFMHEINMPNTFIGKAKCAKEDNWDVELGKMIAFSRAKDKCYKSFFKRANKFVQTIDRRLGDMITVFNDFGVKLENKRENLQQRIEEMTAESQPSEE